MKLNIFLTQRLLNVAACSLWLGSMLIRFNNWAIALARTRINRSQDQNNHCRAGLDGDCAWKDCPQIRDGEPAKSGRSCPLAKWGQEDEDEW